MSNESNNRPKEGNKPAITAGEYPECEKLNAVTQEYNSIAMFLDWLQNENKMAICVIDADGEFCPVRQSQSQILAKYFSIDMNKIEMERRQILQKLSQ